MSCHSHLCVCVCVQMVEAVCLHLQLPAKDSYQRLWLCYEKLFFHMFFRDFLSLYKVRSPYCIDPLPLALKCEVKNWR